MKTITYILLIVNLFSCATNKQNVVKPLYEIILEESYGGTKIEFYEIISEANEIKMFLNDPELKNKVKPSDIETANFAILNHGEKNTGGYTIGVESVLETEKNIVIKVKKTAPKSGENVTNAFTSPMCIVKINSKKPIVFE